MFMGTKITFMKQCRIYPIILFAIALSFNAFGQDNEETRPTREKWFQVEMEGTVSDINPETREITLIGPKGNLVTIIASDAVKRFDEIEVNDIIAFEFWTYMKAEFRKPTPEEEAEPIVMIAEAGKAPEGMPPGAVVGAVVKAIVTIEVLNRPFMLVTIKGPKGNFMTIEVEDPAILTELHIGQVVIFTYAEAVAVSLQKVNVGDSLDQKK